MFTRMTLKNKMDLPSLGWKVPQEVKESFIEFCTRVGTHYQQDCAGALFVWQYLPAQIREWAKLAAKGEPAVSVEFWQSLLDSYDAAILGQRENQAEHEKRTGTNKRA